MNQNPYLYAITALGVMVIVLILQGERLQVDMSFNPIDVVLFALASAQSSDTKGRGKDG
jgi:hypothetical protein